jgi:hypothetical protein
MKYDVTIKAHEKDYYKLDLVVDSLKFLNPQPENIYIISPNGFLPNVEKYNNKLKAVLDKDVIPFIDKNRLKYRPNWTWINLVSILQDFTENDLYFDVQSDNFFTRPIDLFDENGKPKLFQSTTNPNNNYGWPQYFNFSKKVFDLEKISMGYSHIIEFIMYDKKLLKKIFEKYNSYEEMMDYIYDNINENSYPADQEIFGNLVEKYFKESYSFVPNAPIYLAGTHEINTDKNFLEQYIQAVQTQLPNAIACSYHTWI